MKKVKPKTTIATFPGVYGFRAASAGPDTPPFNSVPQNAPPLSTLFGRLLGWRMGEPLDRTFQTFHVHALLRHAAENTTIGFPERYSASSELPAFSRYIANGMYNFASRRDNAPVKPDDLKARIHELVVKARTAPEDEYKVDAILTELQKALHEHSDSLRKLVSSAGKATK